MRIRRACGAGLRQAAWMTRSGARLVSLGAGRGGRDAPCAGPHPKVRPSPRQASRVSSRGLAGACAIALSALAASGCGSTGLPEGGDTSRGRELFIPKCGSCHTLADAGTKGQIGPNLDDAFRQARKDGLGEDDDRVGHPRPDRLPGRAPDDRCNRDAEGHRHRRGRGIGGGLRRLGRRAAGAGAAQHDGRSGDRHDHRRDGRSRRQGRLRDRRLRRLPHARRGRRPAATWDRTSTTPSHRRSSSSSG